MSMNKMKITPTLIPEVLLIAPQIFYDQRGLFYESYRANSYSKAGISNIFVQENVSYSKQNVIRGLHYQLDHPQGKLVTVTQGEVLDVVVDIRKNSPTFGKWVSQVLSEENHFQLYIPQGFAHGFCVLSPQATLIYKCTDYYCPSSDYGISWSDQDIGIKWPIATPILSAKDSQHKCLADIPPELLP